MAYVKQNWECGEMITADKLNHMEDGIANAGGDCDCGFECTEAQATLTNETVTTTAQGTYNMGALSYSQMIDADTITVTFDGTEYECSGVEAFGGYIYGGFSTTPTPHPDFSQYPFTILSQASGNSLATETAGTYTIKIEAVETTVTTTSCFKRAVESVSDNGYACYGEGELIFAENVTPLEVGEGRYGTRLPFNKIVRSSIDVSINGGEYEHLDGDYNSNGAVYGDPNLQDSQCYFYVDDSGWAFVTTLSDVHTIAVKADSGGTIATTPCFESAVESIMPCHASVQFRQRESVTVAANSTANIMVYPSSNSPKVYGAAIMGFYLHNSLSCYQILPTFNTSEYVPYLEYFVIAVKNNTETPIIIGDANLTVYGEVECVIRAQ